MVARVMPFSSSSIVMLELDLRVVAKVILCISLKFVKGEDTLYGMCKQYMGRSFLTRNCIDLLYGIQNSDL